MTTTSVGAQLKVEKRNGQIADFDRNKIMSSVSKSAADVGQDINGSFDNLIESIISESHVNKSENNIVKTSDITGIVKRKLMDYQYHRVAESYILYSNKQERARLEPDSELMSDFVVQSRYARYIPSLKRREVFSEIIDRVEGMHKRRYPEISEDIHNAFKLVREKKVLPSMRSMQFGGKAQEKNHAKGYNCSFSVCNRPRFFAETFWLLLSGTGVGFSVQFQHVDQLPDLKFVNKKSVKHFTIPDTIEGWSDAIDELINSYFKTGQYVEFAYHKIRSEGSILKTSGGRAPGHLPLKEAIENCRKILDHAQGRQLRPIECYDLVCMIADAVYAGGIREAATICLFSIDDGEMMNAKTGDWYTRYPWRARSNNSVVLNRNEIKKSQYDRIFKATKQWGEPGFYFTNDEDTGTNPCFTGNMRLLTEHGYKTIYDLWVEGGMNVYSKEKSLDHYGVQNIINSHGSVIASNVFKTSDSEDVYRITLNNGDQIETTKNHEWITLDDKRVKQSKSSVATISGRTKVRKKCHELKIGDRIPLINNYAFGKSHDPSLARAIGWCIGDGSIASSGNRQSAILRFWNDDIAEIMPSIREDLLDIYAVHNRSSDQKPSYDGRTGGFNYSRKDIESSVLGKVMAENGLVPGHKHRIPEFIWGADKETVGAFIQGIFSADGGSCVNENRKSVTITLAQNDKKLLQDIQKLLLMFGIASTITRLRPEHRAQRPDGKGGHKEYLHKESHRLIITSIKSCKIFASEIGFMGSKQDTLFNRLSSYGDTQGSYGYSKVKKIEYVGKKPVYCLHEPKNNEVSVNTVQMGQCCEIGLNPKLEITPEVKMDITQWAQDTNRKIPKLKTDNTYWGFQFCNLSEVNAATATSPEDLYERVKAAAIIGTLQAGYTDFPYLGWVSEAICNREALLGVSLTGIMDNPDVALDPEVQSTAAQIAVETNIEFARKIGIKPAARVTCVKPSGTASIVLGAVGSGIHTHHAKRYFRRIRGNPNCPIYQKFKSVNPHLCSVIDSRKELITFPIKANESAMTRHDMDAIEFLKRVLSTQRNWVMPGTAKPKESIGLNHNVSNTITVKEDEWDDVREFLWKNRKYFSGVSMLADFGDKAYANAPREEVITESDEDIWYALIYNSSKIDWSKVVEEEDNTDLTGEKACAGGACSL